jgi:hypothetical protein
MQPTITPPTVKGVIMADQQDLETLLATLMAIPEKEVRYPDMPVDQAAKEGQVMAIASDEDSAKFTAIGVAKERILELGVSVGALRAAQAKLIAALGEVKEAGRQWMDEEPNAVELRSELLDTLSYGLRNVPNAKKALKRIRQGDGSLDTINDILSLAELGSKYRSELEKMNYDTAQLDAAAEKGAFLSKLFAKAFIEKSTAGAKDLRDRAFTYMRRIMGEILDAAEYVFRKNPDRLEFYHSAYRARKKSGAKTEVTDTTPAPEEKTA